MAWWLLDVESRSRCDLRAHGGRRYWAHPSTEVLCVVGVRLESPSDDGGPLHLYSPHLEGCGDPLPIAPGDTLVAHNAVGFDRFAIARLGWRALDASPAWVDSADLARRAGLPGALDALGTRLLGVPKDAAGSRLTVGLSTARRPTKARPGVGGAVTPEAWRLMTDAEKRAAGVQADLTPEVLIRVLEYCAADVEIMVRAWPALRAWLDVDAEVLPAERAVRDRGVWFDRELAHALLRCDVGNAGAVVAEAAALLGMPDADLRAVVRSPAQFTAATGAPNAQRETVAAMAADDADPECQAAARARLALATIASGKLEAGLARVCPDGRLRDSVRYYAAHTGRWGGSGLQPQNLPRPSAAFESWEDCAIDALARQVTEGAHHATPEEIDLLLRATLAAPPGHVLAVADWAGIEARALAWAAGDSAALEGYHAGRDAYKAMAARVFGVAAEDVTKAQRTIGKVAELACGYGMGAGKFEATAGAATLAGAGVDAEAVVAAWRAQHAPVVALWRAVEQAMRGAADGHAGRAGPWEFAPDTHSRDVAVYLPSGRPVVYPDCRVRSDPDRPGRDGRPRQVLTFQGGKSGLEYTYGGKLVENLVQATCRDILADALVRCEAAALPVVLHVHDEIVAEVPEAEGAAALERLLAIMLALPPWAAGMPVGAEGYVGRRYRK